MLPELFVALIGLAYSMMILQSLLCKAYIGKAYKGKRSLKEALCVACSAMQAS